MFNDLKEIVARPEPFQFYTADILWADPHISKKMLDFHLDGSNDISSRNRAFIDRSAAWISSHFGIDAPSSVADFGCGPGLYTIRLAEYKADITGIDFSQRSIQIARKTTAQKGLAVNYVNQNYLEFETDKRFDLIIMITCDYCALSPQQRNGLLTKFNKLMKPGGSVLLDVYSLNAFDQREEASRFKQGLMGGFWSSEDYFGFLNTFKYDEEKVVLDKYTIIEKERKRVVYNWLQYFTPESLAKEFEENGFKITAFYSDVAGTPFNPGSQEMAVEARKES
jgi:2-polyprenyl-3-methyl-5-hydroxy-6-metoxy-1,4-benzoquinol methylase